MRTSLSFAVTLTIVFAFCFIAESNAHESMEKILAPWEEAQREFNEVFSMHSTDLPDTIVLYDTSGNMRVFVDTRIAESRKAILTEQENPAPPAPRGFASLMAQELLKEDHPQRLRW